MSYHTAAPYVQGADSSYLTNLLISFTLAFAMCAAVWRYIHPNRPAFALGAAWAEVRWSPLSWWAQRAPAVGRHRRPGWWAGRL